MTGGLPPATMVMRERGCPIQQPAGGCSGARHRVVVLPTTKLGRWALAVWNVVLVPGELLIGHA